MMFGFEGLSSESMELLTLVLALCTEVEQAKHDVRVCVLVRVECFFSRSYISVLVFSNPYCLVLTAKISV